LTPLANFPSSERGPSDRARAPREM
jgi:hypothetical protein